MGRPITLAVCFMLCLLVKPALSAKKQNEERSEKPRIEIAILLDTSGSMTGLIDQAREHLWKMVNEFSRLQHNKRRPQLRVALYEYGKSTLPPGEGYSRQIVPLTEDLDRISEELFRLTTNGGQEYCGYAIQQAAEELDWAMGSACMKCIFIAGNEPFTQGPVDYKFACGAATGRNISVSTIFCGPHDLGVATNWEDGAKISDGSYVSINHNRKSVQVTTPFDAEILSLNKLLNSTYIAFGNESYRSLSLARQVAQDTNASNLGDSAAAARASAKATHFYRNDAWDIIDACSSGKLKLEDLRPDQLPQELRKLSIGELRKLVDEKSAKRKKVQTQIQELSKQREAFIAGKRQAPAGEADEETLDSAIIKSVQQQADNKGFLYMIGK